MTSSRPNHEDDATRPPHPVASRQLVVIAASAGGLRPLMDVLSAFPPDFPAAIAVVQHRGEQAPELLPELLRRRSSLPVRHARDGDLLEPGTVYVCPPGVHMTVERSLRLEPGPRLDHVRPNADLMFRSAARAYGTQAVGVVLSGYGRDAAEGCRAVRGAGGAVLAQDPASSEVPGMPMAAIVAGGADVVLPVDRIPAAIAELLAGGGRDHDAPAPDPVTGVLLADDHKITREGLRALLQGERDLTVLAEAEDGRTAVRLAAELRPDVVVMDVGLPDFDGAIATREIVARSPHSRVVALSALDDPETVRRMLDAGAAAYLTKSGAFEELATAIRTVVAGRRYVSPGARGRAVAGGHQRPPCGRRPGRGPDEQQSQSNARHVPKP